MKARTLAGPGLVLVAILGGAAWWTFGAPVGNRDILVPIQVRMADPQTTDQCLETGPLSAPSQPDMQQRTRGARPVADWPLPSVQRFADQLLEHRQAMARCEDTGTLMAHAQEALRRLRDGGDTQRAVALCFGLRWSQPRINEIADPCADLLEHARNRSGAASYARDGEAFELYEIDRTLHHRARNYLANPYCPDRTRSLALALAENGHRDIADRLTAELLQLDTEAAARLEHEIADLDSLPYPGFTFPD